MERRQVITSLCAFLGAGAASRRGRRRSRTISKNSTRSEVSEHVREATESSAAPIAHPHKSQRRRESTSVRAKPPRLRIAV